MSKTARLEAKRPQPANYEDDFHAWTVHQAQLLRTGQLGEADVENIAEEIETLGRSEAAALRSSLRLIVLHLLKFGFQPDRASRSWRVTVVRERINVRQSLEENPSLRPKLGRLFDQAYSDARRIAAAETGLPILTFPVDPPFDLDQVQDENFFPYHERDGV